MLYKKKVIGLISFSGGIGMLLVMIIPHFSFILAVILVALGYYFLFC